MKVVLKCNKEEQCYFHSRNNKWSLRRGGGGLADTVAAAQ